ncbi:MAG: sensor histidine kinase [Ramlibacter sp.]|nr:sensor histidine kinase [Ramlibacter sp.]
MPGSTGIRSRRGPGQGGTEAGRALAPLARSLAAMRAILQATTNAILVIDRGARVTDFNDRFVSMWSVPAEVILRRDDSALLDWMERGFADPAAFRARISSIDAHDPPTTDVLHPLDGRTIERHSSAQVIGGATIGRVWSFVDVTHHERTRQQLREETEILSWLNRTGLALSSTLEPLAVVEAVTRASMSFSGALAGSFIPHPSLADPELLPAFRQHAGPPAGASLLQADSHAALAQATQEWQQAFRCDDLERDEAARGLFVRAAKDPEPLGVRSLLVVPVAPRPDLVLGALALEHPAAGGFPERVQRLIGALSTHAAIAIDNARLHARVRKESTERKLLANLQRTSAQRLQSLSRRLMQAEEEERKRLGRELHDRVGGNLSALGMGLELLRKQLPDDHDGAIDKRVDDLQDILRDTMAHVRGVLAELRPTALEDLGLLPALRHQAGVLSARSGIQFPVRGSEPSPRLTPDCEIAFYRVAQEAWSNAMKHSGAHSVALTVSQQRGSITMVIEDDGHGFEPAELSAGTPSLGLTTMRERAQAIGAVLEVGAAVGAGVCVRLSLARGSPA